MENVRELMIGAKDTHQHIDRLAAKIDALWAAQVGAEEQHFHRLKILYESGHLDADFLLDLMWEWAAQKCLDGWQDRWALAGLPDEDALLALYLDGLKHRQNTSYGWEGTEFRPSRDHPMPRSGQSVVYVLYDARNDPCYVGSTGDLCQRLKAHRRSGKRFVYWIAYPCANRTAAYQLEDRLLKEKMPYLNRKRGA